MSTPAQINTLRASDFPDGIATKADADKLFQYLNPFFAALQAITNHGTSLADNINVQIASFNFTSAPVFVPLVVRLKNKSKPALVLCTALNTQTHGVEPTWNPAWTYQGQAGGTNQVQIDDLPGLTNGTQYAVTVFVFF